MANIWPKLRAVRARTSYICFDDPYFRQLCSKKMIQLLYTILLVSGCQMKISNSFRSHTGGPILSNLVYARISFSGTLRKNALTCHSSPFVQHPVTDFGSFTKEQSQS